MNTQESLKDIERRAYRSTLNHGFYEIGVGGLFLLFAWIPICESVGISRFVCYPFILPLAAIPWLGKRYVAIPRLGAVEFGPQRRNRNRLTAFIGVVALILLIPLLTMVLVREADALTWQMITLAIAPVLAIGVILLNYSRLYLYAVLFLFSTAAADFLLPLTGNVLSALLAFGLPGLAVLAFGLSLLVSFLKEYPQPVSEAPHVNR